MYNSLCQPVIDLFVDFGFWCGGAPQVDEPMAHADSNVRRAVLFLKELNSLCETEGTIYQPLRSGRIWHKVNF